MLCVQMEANLKGLRMKQGRARFASNAATDKQEWPVSDVPDVAFSSSDIFRLDTQTLVWRKTRIAGEGVGKVYGHTAVHSASTPGNIYVVSGKRENRAALDAIFILHTYKKRWSQVSILIFRLIAGGFSVVARLRDSVCEYFLPGKNCW